MLTTLLALVSATPALAGARAELSLPFTDPAPGRETGLRMDLRYLDADDPSAKPPTISELELRLPEGTRIDPAALPACQASDAEIQLLGRDACPPESLVGTGTLEVYLGAPGDPQTTDLALFNAPGQILEVLFFEGTNVTVALEHLFVEGAAIRARPAQVPPGAPPDTRVAASHIVWDFPPHGGYLVTPAACPAGGAWRTEGRFAFADGSTAAAGALQACPGPRVSLAVAPRRLVRGRRTRLRIRLRSDDAGCLAGAAVRVGPRRARTDDRGRTAITVRPRRRGSLVIWVRTRGCGTARAGIPVSGRR